MRQKSKSTRWKIPGDPYHTNTHIKAHTLLFCDWTHAFIVWWENDIGSEFAGHMGVRSFINGGCKPETLHLTEVHTQIDTGTHTHRRHGGSTNPSERALPMPLTPPAETGNAEYCINLSLSFTFSVCQNMDGLLLFSPVDVFFSLHLLYLWHVNGFQSMRFFR